MTQAQITAETTAVLFGPLLPLLAIIATRPVIPAPAPAPVHTAWLLPDRENCSGEREPDRGELSLASIRLSISVPIRSTKLYATAAS